MRSHLSMTAALFCLTLASTAGVATAGERAILRDGRMMNCSDHHSEGRSILLTVDGGTVSLASDLVERFEILPDALTAEPPALMDAPPATIADLQPEAAASLLAADPAAGESVQEMSERIATEFSVDPRLVEAVIHVESGGNPFAVSPKGAGGLMQLMPMTADRFDVRDVFDPAENVRGGVRYLRWLMDRFKGDLAMVLAAYNAGEGAVDRHLGIPPYRETRHYVLAVLGRYLDALRLSAAE